jgi:hypothetical protein
MNVYMYQASIYCEDCGKAIRDKLKDSAPDNPEDETAYDSDEYPKGPYADGGGEADRPWHCETCKRPLGNPLTRYGVEYVLERIVDCLIGGADNPAVRFNEGWYKGASRYSIIEDWARQIKYYNLDLFQQALVNAFLDAYDEYKVDNLE